MSAWRRPDRLPKMDSLGVVSFATHTIIGRRHDVWLDVALVHSHPRGTDAPTVAGWVVAAVRDEAPIHVVTDGACCPVLHLRQLGVQIENVGEADVWALRQRLRDALDPRTIDSIVLPPDPCLLDALAGQGDEDGRGLATILAMADTPRRSDVLDRARCDDRREFNPLSPRALWR